tara:strand:+ start:476 stop:1009 length:534 start_codon:yes stop_codon:yes gene_type:complete
MARKFEVQSYATAAKHQVTVSYDHYNSLSICNIGASAAVSVDLWITDQNSGTTNSTETFQEAATAGTNRVLTTSASASADIHTNLFNGEKLWKIDGTLFGTCTGVNSATEIVFTTLESAVAISDAIFVGTDYYLLNNVEIPNGVTLKLSGDEFNFDRTQYKLYIQPTVAAAIQTILR